MTTVDATADESGRSGTLTHETAAPPAAVVGPMAGDPGMLGLGSFIVGSVALGLGLVGVVPVGVLGAPLAIILSATALGLLLAAVWAAAVGQSAVAAIFGIFGTFWLSYAVLVLGVLHNWFALVTTAPAVNAVPATVKLFLVSWLVVVVMLTLATLRLPSAFTVLFALVSLALLLLLLAFAEAPAGALFSTGLLKTGGYVVLVFAALGVYLFAGAAAAGTGGKGL